MLVVRGRRRPRLCSRTRRVLSDTRVHVDSPIGIRIRRSLRVYQNLVRADWLGRDLAVRGSNAPDHIAGIISNKERTRTVDPQTDRASFRLIALDEARDDILRFAGWLAMLEWHVHHLVAVEAVAVPTAVLATKAPLAYAVGSAEFIEKVRPSAATWLDKP